MKKRARKSKTKIVVVWSRITWERENEDGKSRHGVGSGEGKAAEAVG